MLSAVQRPGREFGPVPAGPQRREPGPGPPGPGAAGPAALRHPADRLRLGDRESTAGSGDAGAHRGGHGRGGDRGDLRHGGGAKPGPSEAEMGGPGRDDGGYIGYFDHYEIYNSDEDGTTYKLIYSYSVNSKEYTVSTDYGTNMIPKEGSSRTIKYNPSNPSEAIISGGSSEIVLLLIGIMFTMIPFVIFINMSPKIKEKLDNLNFNVTTLLIGIVFLIIGFMALYMMTGTFSIIEMYKSFSLNYLIPYLILLIFIIVGILLIIGSFKRNSE